MNRHKGLLVIDRCLRSLKRTQIQMMPMYHWAGRRIENHAKNRVLALLLERVTELECEQPWSHIRASLAKLQATRFRNSQHIFFQINSPPNDCRELLKKLETPLLAKVSALSHSKNRCNRVGTHQKCPRPPTPTRQGFAARRVL